MRSWRFFFRTGTLPQTNMEVWKMIFPDFQVPAVGFPLILAHQNSKPQKGKSTAVTYSLRSFRPFLERKEKMDLQNGPMRNFAQRSAYFLFKLAYLPSISCESSQMPYSKLTRCPVKTRFEFPIGKRENKKNTQLCKFTENFNPRNSVEFLLKMFQPRINTFCGEVSDLCCCFMKPWFQTPPKKKLQQTLDDFIVAHFTSVIWWAEGSHKVYWKWHGGC